MELIVRRVFSGQAVAQIGLGRHFIQHAIGIDNAREGELQRAKIHLFRDHLIAPSDATKQAMAEGGKGGI